jgi:hypothetical protein
VKTKRTKEQVLKAIAGSKGIKTHIASRLDVGRETLDTYLRRWPECQSAYEVEVEVILDQAEAKLYQLAIVEGAERSLHFLLERKGRSRGYGKRQELAHTADQPAEIIFRIGKSEESS